MTRKKFRPLRTSSNILIIFTALFWMAFANTSFFSALLLDYPLNAENSGFLIALILSITASLILGLGLLCHRYTTKPVLITLLITSSFAAYFMDNYGIIIDRSMIANALETNSAEASDLFSLTLVFYVFFLGLIPAYLVYKANLVYQSFGRELLIRLKLMALLLIIMLGSFFLYSANASSYFREHKAINRYLNPTRYVIETIKFTADLLSFNHNRPLLQIGTDAHIPSNDPHRELFIMVVGETARADRFSLNGYEKKTNPLLDKQDVVSFSAMESCGTSTAVSVPCMFSIDHEDGFDTNTARHKENALDILQRAGVNVLWRDNNSSSKHVADRITYQNYLDPSINTICDSECRDEGMLVGLQDYINQQKEGDILIVLHQMGSHGPAYYKRYPKEFERFTPACQTNELSDCTREEVGNAYDNTIVYTDYFLDKTIELLKKNDETFETALLYISDHGESLGENGLYLHGMPNLIAPQSQRHVPAIMWLGKNFDEINIETLKNKKDQAMTHDNIFHTLLGVMEINSKVYKKHMDFIRN